MIWIVILFVVFILFIASGDIPVGAWKWIVGFTIAALIGFGFLYQQGGGKIFGAGGLIGPPAPPEPPTLYDFKIEKYETGLFSSTLTLKNETTAFLRDIELVLTLYREDGIQIPVKKFWAKWPQGGLQDIEFPAASYPKMTLGGIAMKNETKVKLNSAWTFTKK